MARAAIFSNCICRCAVRVVFVFLCALPPVISHTCPFRSTTAGYYCPAGSISSAASLCAAGFYGTSSSFTASTCAGACTPTPGSYCPSGSVSATGTACPVSNYCTSMAAPPTPCPAGRYGFAAGLSSPLCVRAALGVCVCVCVRDSVPHALAAPQSGACNPGFYCPTGSTNASAVSCPAGRFASASGSNSSACGGPCAAGHYCVAGSTSATAVACPAGTYGALCGVRGLCLLHAGYRSDTVTFVALLD